MNIFICFLIILLMSKVVISYRLLPSSNLQHNNIKTVGRVNFVETSNTKLYGKIAKAEGEAVQETSGKPEDKNEMVSLPYSGIAGYEPNNLFYQPVDTFDPLKDTADLPGEDGSDEKIAAIQQRIQDRVEELRKAGEWDDDETGGEYGQDPLKNQSILATMAMQIKVCRPFESVSELGLTYILVVSATVLLMAYLIFLREFLDTAVTWYLNADFEF